MGAAIVMGKLGPLALGIPGGDKGYLRLGHEPCCGLLESNYYLPLRYAPLELTIVSDGHAPPLLLVIPWGISLTTPTQINTGIISQLETPAPSGN